jgi:hypothetical protein
VYICHKRHNEVERFPEVVNGDELAANIQIEEVFFVTYAHAGELGGGDQESRLWALTMDRFSGNTGRRSDFRECGTCVTVGSEQLGRRGDHPCPGLLRLLLAQL